MRNGECIAPTDPIRRGARVAGGNLREPQVSGRGHINQIRDTPGLSVWQRNYYEHISRTERALRAIREYITQNPARWQMDRYNTLAVKPDPMAAELWHLLEQETR